MLPTIKIQPQPGAPDIAVRFDREARYLTIGKLRQATPSQPSQESAPGSLAIIGDVEIHLSPARLIEVISLRVPANLKISNTPVQLPDATETATAELSLACDENAIYSSPHPVSLNYHPQERILEIEFTKKTASARLSRSLIVNIGPNHQLSGFYCQLQNDCLID
jgi:hypothetical protein